MERVILIGSEDVTRAAYVIKDSSATMLQTAVNMEQVFSDQRRFMDDWLQRLEFVMNKTIGEK